MQLFQADLFSVILLQELCLKYLLYMDNDVLSRLQTVVRTLVSCKGGAAILPCQGIGTICCCIKGFSHAASTDLYTIKMLGSK